MEEKIHSVLVTGSNRGIGLELVRQFATKGLPPDLIFAACRDPSKAQDLKKLIQEHPNVIILQIDLEKDETIQSAFDIVENQIRESGMVKQEFGDVGLDLLINNAGVDDKLSLEDVTRETMLKTFNVNTVGTFTVTMKFLPLLQKAANRSKRSNPKIINISSQLSCMTERSPTEGHVAYKMSKTAINSITVQLADELRREGIAIASVCPGWVRTDMGGSSAFLSPEESVSGVMALIDKLTMEDSGKFYKYSGIQLDW